MRVQSYGAEHHAHKPFYRHLYFWVLLAIVAGALIGHYYPDLGVALKPLGDGFIKLVKMIIAPVIFLTIVTGLAGMGSLKGVGSVVGKAFGYFLFFSTLALIVGLIVANVIQPGAGMNIDPATLDNKAVADYAAKAHESTITGFLMAIIPTTVVSALTQGDILQVLFVSILTGVSCILIGEAAQPFVKLCEAGSAIMFKMVTILMKVAPLGAFGAFAF
ncbi:MAG TPA: cation:dicarboxylase symporter family transporter, partial [Paenirhodobacter sp.]